MFDFIFKYVMFVSLNTEQKLEILLEISLKTLFSREKNRSYHLI